MMEGLKGLRVQVSEASEGADEEVKVHRDMQFWKVELRGGKRLKAGHPLNSVSVVRLRASRVSSVCQGAFALS